MSEDTKGHVRHHLAAILFAGHSRFVPGDEAGSFAGLNLGRTEIIEPQVLKCGEKGIRLSPSDPRLFMWLPPLAAAHYQLRNYAQSVEIGRRSGTLNAIGRLV